MYKGLRPVRHVRSSPPEEEYNKDKYSVHKPTNEDIADEGGLGRTVVPGVWYYGYGTEHGDDGIKYENTDPYVWKHQTHACTKRVEKEATEGYRRIIWTCANSKRIYIESLTIYIGTTGPRPRPRRTR